VKILMVDNSPMIRAAINGLLERMGHTTIAAANGKEALQLYEREEPDLVLIEILLPEMDGLEAARRMREARPDRWIPIIFLSTKEADQDLDRAIEAGGDDYLVKPVSYIVLNAKIRAMQRIDTMRRELIKMSQELVKLSNQDGLTGIANRRYFDSYLLTTLRSSTKNREPVSLILSDIDHFKAFNDCYGHQVGDDCLRRVAQAFSGACRFPSDLPARYGGEEFAMVLPGATPDEAIDVTNSVNRLVAQLAIPHARSETSPNITVSQGVMSLIPTEETLPTDLIGRADQALYQAKHDGRNRYVVFGAGSVTKKIPQSPG
jgi:diguanylate cyclase (GGDEF)-like protein